MLLCGKKTVFGAALIIILVVTFISFSPCLDNGFVNWDDDVHLLDNDAIRSLDRKHVVQMFTTTVNHIYIPMTLLSFAVEYRFVEYEPFWYHLNNLLLHLAVVSLVFYFFVLIGIPFPAVCVATVIFAVHPIHVESVAWITERKDVLYSFFYMISMCAYVLYIPRPGGAKGKGQSRRREWVCLSIVYASGIVSMLAKPMALSLPFILLLVDWFLGRSDRRRTIMEKIPLMIILGGIGWVTYSAEVRLPDGTVIENVLVWLWSFVFYLRQFFFPLFSVPIFRLHQPISLLEGEYLFSALIFLLLMSLPFVYRRNKIVLFSCFFYFLSCFFLFRFDAQDTNVVADRFMYLPSMGFCLLIGIFVNAVRTRFHQYNVLKISSYIIIFVVIAAFSIKTYFQCDIWENGVTLWSYQLEFFPKDYIALNNYANALRNEDEYQEAIGYVRSLRNDGGNARIYNRNEQLSHLNKINRLLSLYNASIEGRPGYRNAFYNIGTLYGKMGDYDKALLFFQKTIEIQPFDYEAYFNLGISLEMLGHYKEAVEAYSESLRQNCNDEYAYINMIQSYSKALDSGVGGAEFESARSRVLEAYQALSISPRAAIFYEKSRYFALNNRVQDAVHYLQKAFEANSVYFERMQAL